MSWARSFAVSLCGALAFASCGHQGERGTGPAEASAAAAGADSDEPGRNHGGAGDGPVPGGGDGSIGADDAGGMNGAGAAGEGGAGSGGEAGAGATPPPLCSAVSQCDDSDACTHDACDAVAGCVHVNPSLDCRGWSGVRCAAAAIAARGSGERITCVPPTTLAQGVTICADQVCAGAPGCELTYELADGAVTSTQQGYDLEGRVVALAGTVTGAKGPIECSFEVGLSAPAPFLVHYRLARPGCSQVVRVDASPEATWSSIVVQASSPQCAAIVSLLRSLLTTAELNAYLEKPLEDLACAACSNDCPGGVVCR